VVYIRLEAGGTGGTGDVFRLRIENRLSSRDILGSESRRFDIVVLEHFHCSLGVSYFYLQLKVGPASSLR